MLFPPPLAVSPAPELRCSLAAPLSPVRAELLEQRIPLDFSLFLRVFLFVRGSASGRTLPSTGGLSSAGLSRRHPASEELDVLFLLTVFPGRDLPGNWFVRSSGLFPKPVLV